MKDMSISLFANGETVSIKASNEIVIILKVIM